MGNSCSCCKNRKAEIVELLKREREYEKMCAGINTAINKLDKGGYTPASLLRTIGEISGLMFILGKRGG